MLARKVVTRRGRGFRGYFPSQKLGRMVAWESLHERDAILLLEFCREVVSYQEQPTVIQYFDGHQMREYYPDFEVLLEDQRRIHLEIKSSTQVAKPKVAKKLRAIAAHYQSRDQLFQILTEKELRREPLLTNVRALIKLKRHSIPALPSEANLIQDLGIGPQPLRVAEDLYGRDTAWRLVAAGRLVCDLNLPLASDTSITVATGGGDAAFLF